MKKSLISAIKKLLTKLGAEDIEGNNLVDVIDNGADAIAQPSAELPAAAAADAGKVPVVQEAGGYALEEIPTELPTATAADNGKFVGVDENGGYTLAEAGGGVDVLTLYAKNNDEFLYLDISRTQKFRNDNEAMQAIDNATKIVIIDDEIVNYRQRRYYPASVYRLWFPSGSYAVYLLANAFTATGNGDKPTITPEVKQFTLAYYHD